jgi:hypothetical protein
VAQQQVFDLFGSDLLAATVNLIFLAPLHGDVTLWINRDQIAGTVKTVGIKGAGIVGWCDSEGNGEWVVTIRCAKLRENQVRLFAGAGIVPASSPLGEWRETGVKLSTMLNVFGLH